MVIKAVLFDLDDTLYDYYKVSNPALIKVHKKLIKKVNISLNQFLKILDKSKKEIRKELKHSPDSHDRIIYFQRMGEKLNLNLDFTLKLYDLYYKEFLKNIKRKKGVLKTFKRLKELNLKICIITNEVIEIQLRKTKKLKLNKYIDYFIASENTGIDKPNKKIFSYALKKLNIKPQEAVMIGDQEQSDILGAKKRKINTILISKQKNTKSNADFIIKSIPEVLKILKNINKKEKR